MLPNRTVHLPHDYPFDPTHGYDLHALLNVSAPPAPAGLSTFWQRRYLQTIATPPRPLLHPTDLSNEHYDVSEIEFDSFDGFRVGGWISIPRHQPAKIGLIMGHGYGGRPHPDVWDKPCNAATIFPCARGFHRSARPDWPDDAQAHVLKGIESIQTYSHGLCAADLWAAGSALSAVVNDVSGNLRYWGGSFGGGIGAMAVPWDQRIRRAFLDVPSFGNHRLRVTLPCTGSGAAVRTYYQHDPSVLNVLSFFDAAIHAHASRTPTMVAAAMFDPAVPPPGQFAVYNALHTQKKLFVRTAGHHTYPEEAVQTSSLWRESWSWLGITL
ncbi:MAG: acetylxylan esterase [Phycisphaerales bacterium]|nr:acetylxylan esterase [Phycisphaerales bacterium]